MYPEDLLPRYQDLQTYLSWTDQDRENVVAAGPWLATRMPALVDDFYDEIARHAGTRSVLTGGQAQVTRLKSTLTGWLEQLFAGQYDLPFVQSRWRVGLRHSEIGLRQVYANAALSRLRRGMHRGLHEAGLAPERLWEIVESLDKLLDLDLAIIEDSYEFHRLQRETTAERERGDRKFRDLVEAAACMIVIMRDDTRIVYFSPYAERLTGYRTQEVHQQPFFELFAVQQDDKPYGGLERQARERLPVKELELAIRCRDGSRRRLVWNAIGLDDFEGEPAVLTVGHDITEMRRALDRLLQAERLAAIGQTITGLAHESRNALQRIHSCSEMLEFEVEDRPAAVQLLRRSQQAQDDLARLFDEVRNYAAPIQLELAACSVSGIWREAWSLVQNECQGRDVTLCHQPLEDEPALSVDRFRLVQVFRNLFENSLAACHDPVRIEVTCRLVDDELDEPAADEPSATAAQPPRRSWLEIRVKDNGPGLSPRACREVFEPFFTTKTKGTGLGMAIAQRVLVAHGGSISVGQIGQGGAEFVLRLPRVEL